MQGKMKHDGNVQETDPLLQGKKTTFFSPSTELFLKRFASSMGFFSGGYHCFGMDLALQMLALEYGGAVINPGCEGLIVSICYIGIILGQLVFGSISDYIGRKWLFVCVAGLTVVGSCGSAFVTNPQNFSLPVQLCVFRFLLGFGLGGEYPLSASVTAESTEDPDERARSLVGVYQTQAWGMLVPCLVCMICLASRARIAITWRILLFCSGLPSALAMVLRSRMQESETFQAAVKNEEKILGHTPRTPRTHADRVWSSFKEYKLILVGCSVNWFVANLIINSLGAFKGLIFLQFLGVKTDESQNVARNSQLGALTSAFCITGFLLAFLLINRAGRFMIQLIGFIEQTAVFLLLAWTEYVPHVPFCVVFILVGLIFFFQNFGPNTTCFVIPGETFPTHVRATFTGLAGAMGKAGGLLGTLLVPIMKAHYGLTVVYFALAALTLIGTITTVLLTPRKVMDPDAKEKNFGRTV